MSEKSTIYVSKRPGFDTSGKQLLQDLKTNLRITGLTEVRIFNRYEIRGIPDTDIDAAISVILSEPPLDEVFREDFPHGEGERILGIEFLPGQYDQRADSTAQCFQIFSLGERPEVATARFFLFKGDVSEKQFKAIRNYLVNPVDSRETHLGHSSLDEKSPAPPSEVLHLTDFTESSSRELEKLLLELNLSLGLEDLLLIQNHFRTKEKRPPTLTEIRMLDTYWSDHCRHTTFHTKLDPIRFDNGPYRETFSKAFSSFMETFHACSQNRNALPTLMDIATMSMRNMRREGKLEDMEVSGEINACSIIRTVRESDSHREWLIMFKNETHNHPTEIEPFGGAATCLGGAIRDPLSGRAYVYQAMRVTGCGNPGTPVEQTLAGKLPQRKITTEAAHGYSSYGNQIGLATGLVREIYHPGYTAKRMEVGAVIGAVPRENVIRMEPETGDRILLVGGRTGRDGIGGATGSSRGHTERSLTTAGAEVQKGNPPEERKIQRLFRNPEVIRMIKKCNDFGAGGVSVAVGELADGLDIFLDRIPLKYQGLNGTELALSESQERMAVVVAPEDVSRFIQHAAAENLDATEIARVTDSNRMRMYWRNKAIVDLDRVFLDSHGVTQKVPVRVLSPDPDKSPFQSPLIPEQKEVESTWIALLEDLNVCSQIGLVEQFDASIGAGSVHFPLGGRYQETPVDAMIARIPILEGETRFATAMSFGFDPRISSWSPFHGGVFAVIESLARLTAVGVDFRSVRLSLQEYFEKLGNTPSRWGKPLSALLGAHMALSEMALPAIGGKDSMSGSFNDLDVPPTLIAFSVGTLQADQAVSPEFKGPGNHVYLIPVALDQNHLPCFPTLRARFNAIYSGIQSGQVLSARAVGAGGLAEACTKMCLGNRVGFEFHSRDSEPMWFTPGYGAFILEVAPADCPAWLREAGGKRLGVTQVNEEILGPELHLPLERLRRHWKAPLESVFQTRSHPESPGITLPLHPHTNRVRPQTKTARPRVLIPVFPGTNCEYDTLEAVQKAGGHARTLVFTNRSSEEIAHSLEALSGEIDQSQILILPGGFSAGDEPEGSGKFIATIFRNPRIRESVNRLLNLRDGLILGICNGFQALIKLGLVPYGEIRDISPQSPTITYNCIGRHVSRMVWTRVLSTHSPWLSNCRPGDIHTVPVSHGEGRFVCSEELVRELSDSGQIATQYADPEGHSTMEYPYNPNGALFAVEGITSPDGRILGKMGHTERLGSCVATNIPGLKEPGLFEAGISYFS